VNSLVRMVVIALQMKSKSTQDYSNGVKVGDIITAYSKGYHRVVNIHRRFNTKHDEEMNFGKMGEEFNSIIEYKMVMDSKYKLKKNGKTDSCDAEYCKVVTLSAIKAEKLEKVKALSEGYDQLIEMLSTIN